MEETPLITSISETQPESHLSQPLLKQTPQLLPENHQENPIETSPFSDYFSHLDPHHTLFQVHTKYNKALQLGIQEQIQQGEVKVRRKKKQFPLKKQMEMTEEQKMMHEKHDLLTKRQEVMQSLNQLQKLEKDWLTQNSSLMRGRKRRSMTLLQEVPNWLKDIQIAIQKHRKFKRSLQQKNIEVKEKEQQIKQQLMKQRLSFLHQMQEEHSQTALKKKQLYQKGKLKNTEMQKQCQQLIQKVKPKKYIHQKVREEEQMKRQSGEEERTLKLEDFRRRRLIEDWDSIREHQEKYHDFLDERKQLWIEQFHQMKEQHRSRLKQYKGLYAQRAREEDSSLKQYALREEQKGLKMLEKIKDYNQYVSEHFKPKIIKKNSSNPETPKQQRRKELDRTQQRMIGLQYLSKAKETVKSCKILPRSHQQPTKGEKGEKGSSLPKIKSQTAYKNYLKEQPIRKKQGTDIDQFQVALTERRGTWAESALSLISKMETNDYSRGDRPMISSAFNKIQLLKAMY